jgi:hypothetical protein
MQPRNIREMLAAACAVSSIAVAACAYAQQSPALSDEVYMRQALAAGPEVIAKDAAVVRPESDGSMRTIRQGTNGFTCLIMGTDRMCADKNSMEFIHAIMHHQPPWPAMLAHPARLAEPATAARMQHPKTPAAIGSSRDRT